MYKRIVRNKEGEVIETELLDDNYEVLLTSSRNFIVSCKKCDDHMILIYTFPNGDKMIDRYGEKIYTKYICYDGFWQIYEQDDNRNLIKYRNSYGTKRSLAYECDDKGKIIKAKQPNGDKISFEYDDNGKLIKSKYQNGYEKSYEYDDKGNKIKTKSSTGYEKSYEYDDQNRLIKTKDSDGSEKSYEYEELKIKEE